MAIEPFDSDIDQPPIDNDETQGEPGFGQPLVSPPSASRQPGVLERYVANNQNRRNGRELNDISSRPQSNQSSAPQPAIANSGVNQPTESPQSRWSSALQNYTTSGSVVDATKQTAKDAIKDKAKNIAGQKAQQAIKSTLTKTATKAATRAATEGAVEAAGLASGAATGGIGTVVTLAIAAGQELESLAERSAVGRAILRQVRSHEQFVKRIVLGIQVLAVATALALITFGFSLLSTVLSPPGVNGGTIAQPVSPDSATNIYNLDVATGNRGATVTDQIASLKSARDLLATTLNNPSQLPQGADIAKAKAALANITALEPMLAADAYSQTRMTTDLKTMATNLNQLYTAIYGDTASLRSAITADFDTHALAVDNTCGNGPITDVKYGPLKPSTLKLLASIGQFAAQNHLTLTVGCIFTGHRKYNNLSVADGNPTCGQSTVINGQPIADNCRGIAFDIQTAENSGATDKLLPWLNTLSAASTLPIAHISTTSAASGQSSYIHIVANNS